jgi:GAF domain-containing protein
LELLNSIGTKSFQGVALKVGNEKLGVLYVNYNRLHGFTGEDRRILETFAYHASLALKKARLLEQVSKARDAARVVAQVTALGNREATLMSVAQGVQEAVGCDVVALFVYDEATNKLEHPPTMAGVRYRDQASRYGEVLPDSIVYTMLLRDEPYIVEIVAQDKLFRDRRFAKDEGIESCVTIPLKAVGHKVGVMFVNYRSPHRFTDDELTNIQLFANQAAVAIRNAQLYDETNERAATLQTLYEAGKTITASLVLDEILKQILQQARQLTGKRGKEACFGDIKLVREERLYFEAVFPEGALERLQRQFERGVEFKEGVDSRVGITGRAARTGEPQLVGNVTQDPDFYQAHEEPTLSELAVPIKIGGQVIGVINVEHPELNVFDEEDLRAMTSLAAQAAIAIQNARQYEELKQTRGLIGARTALAWMGMASSAWRHTIDKHALTIREQAQLLRQDLGRTRVRPVETKPAERIATIERLATQILDKPITPPLSTETGLESVSLSALIGERARQLWQNDPYRQVALQLDLQLPGSTTVRANSEWLRRAFDILIDNAVNAVASREVREITVGTRMAEGGAEAFVSDTGPGIPEEVRAKVGRELIEKPEGTKGLGMGLLIAQTIVQAYRGEIRVALTGPTGTTMVIWLPSERED